MNKIRTGNWFVTCGVAALLMSVAHESRGQDENAFSISGGVTSDSFFGTYPTFAGGYNITDDLAVTTYGIFWGGGNPGDTWGNWTEIGFGVSYDLTDWLSINPQIGFLGGSLLSSGGGGEGIIGDGWVPNLTVNLDDEYWEGQFYSGFYLPMREQDGQGFSQPEFLHYWVSAGRKINKIFSAGIHHEQLLGGTSVTETSVFSWVGPYIQFRNEDKGLFVRASVGWDFDDARDSFWKLSVGVSF